MKKELKDLTLEEVKKICEKGCDYCPRKLVAICEKTGYNLFLLDNLNQEIEVEVDDIKSI